MAQVLIFSWISGVSGKCFHPHTHTHTLALSETDTHMPINSNTEHAVAFFCHTHTVSYFLSAHTEAPKTF